jgi:hypothetical protein
MPEAMQQGPDREKHEIKRCPRCGRSFRCKVNRIVHCECMTVPLAPETLEIISERYNDCLCLACLWHFHRESDAADK